MSSSNRSDLHLFASPSHPCNYLPEQEATTVFADPKYPKSMQLYSTLSQYGFRRSGRHIYRPNCAGCNACVPVRVNVHQFRPRRGQRRTWAANLDLRVHQLDATFSAEHFALYERYLNVRHTAGGMDNPTPEQYLEFLTSEWSNTVFYEFRLESDLVAVAVTDHLSDGLSAVYTFFDPMLKQRRLGVYCVLWQIEKAKRLNLEWLYLGYLIEDSPKMSYKGEYQPQQRYIADHWGPPPGQR